MTNQLTSQQKWFQFRQTETIKELHENLKVLRHERFWFSEKANQVLEDMLGITTLRESGIIKEKPIITIITYAGTILNTYNLDDYKCLTHLKYAIVTKENTPFCIDLFDLSKGEKKIKCLKDIKPFTQITMAKLKNYRYDHYDRIYWKRKPEPMPQIHLCSCKLCKPDKRCEYHQKWAWCCRPSPFAEYREWCDCEGRCVEEYWCEFYDYDYGRRYLRRERDYHDYSYVFHMSENRHLMFNERNKDILKEKRIKRIRKKKQVKLDKEQREKRERNYYKKQRKKRQKSGKKNVKRHRSKRIKKIKTDNLDYV